MGDIAINVEGLGKRYRREQASGGRYYRYKSLRDTFGKFARHPWRTLTAGRGPMNDDNSFWALDNVGFEISRGEVVGIIGRNGAGKSTLLKILSRITKPTTGHVALYGRVGSLLEVGTGFHPELSGRENIYLNGAILGMTRAEVKAKFDEIVAFSETDKSLDTPVKQYSSGMYMRLAFAVAAHLEPEILIVDEVLAVGDVEFQKKCLGKLSQVARDGRTVLFVSHNMNAVEKLCSKVLRLDRGRLLSVSDDVRNAIMEYVSPVTGSGPASEWVNPGRELANPWFTPLRFYIGDADGSPVTQSAPNDAELYVYIVGELLQHDAALCIGYALFESGGTLLYWSLITDGRPQEWPQLQRGDVLRSRLPSRMLNEGRYRIELNMSLHCRQWISCPGTSPAGIELSISGGLSDSPYWMAMRPGLLAPVLGWTVERE